LGGGRGGGGGGGDQPEHLEDLLPLDMQHEHRRGALACADWGSWRALGSARAGAPGGACPHAAEAPCGPMERTEHHSYPPLHVVAEGFWMVMGEGLARGAGWRQAKPHL
jgi:hypothetical protein